MTLRKRCGPPAWRRKARTKFLPKKIRDKIVLTWNRVNTRSCPRSAASFFCRSSENDVRTITGTHNVSDTTPLYCAMDILSLLLLTLKLAELQKRGENNTSDR